MSRIKNRNTEKMSDAFFKGMTVVDYGCGPGRYSIKFAEIVGNQGLVYAVDIHELAIEKLVATPKLLPSVATSFIRRR